MASVLQTIVEKKHYAFVDRLDSWQQGVELSAKSLVADGSVDEDYYKQIVDCIEKYGPYVVFDHYVAMPHSQENAKGVHKTGIGFMRVKEPVSFGKDEDGEEKLAKLFFTLAACNPDDTSYYYFFISGDYHAFSETYEQHQQAIEARPQ